jgi:hypothetical protein
MPARVTFSKKRTCMRSGTENGAAVAVLLGNMIGLSGFTLSPCSPWTRRFFASTPVKEATKIFGRVGPGRNPWPFSLFSKTRTTHGQFACGGKKKGFRLEYRKPLLLNSLIGCGGQI